MRLRTRLAEQFGFQLSSSRGTTTGFPGRTLGLFSIFTCITVEFSSYCQGWAKYVFFIHLCAFTIFQAPVNCPTKRIMCFDPSALTPFDVWILLSRPLIINFAQFSSLLLPSLNNTSSSPLSLSVSAVRPISLTDTQQQQFATVAGSPPRSFYPITQTDSSVHSRDEKERNKEESPPDNSSMMKWVREKERGKKRAHGSSWRKNCMRVSARAPLKHIWEEA